MNKALNILALTGIMLISACTGATSNSEVETLNKTEAVGTPFTKYLAAEYRIYANQEQYEMFDYPDALHFARKGLAAANGDVVMPETLDDWDLDANHIIEMTEARNMLIDVLEIGAREIAADKSAIAQARFDCWVEQQEENWQTDEIAECKSQFFAALAELQALTKPAPAPVAVEEALPAPITETVIEPAMTPLEQAVFIVFFDWDKHSLSNGANDVLDALVSEVQGRNDVNTVVITGHTDSSGSNVYNQKLSLKRAKSIKDGLIARGLSTSQVRVEAKGEGDLLVKTGDNVREPANRRAQISLE